MTNKEIIIDGVNVSECEFLWKEKLPKKVCNNGNLDCDCNSNPNCYYKQLKRKEQALDEIEKYLDAQQKYFDGEDYHNLLDIINKTKGKTNAY